MCYIGNETGLFVGSVPASTLVFDPAKVALLVGWIYLCMYCIVRIQYSSLLSERYKPIFNALSLVAGPLVLLVLIATKTTVKLHKGNGGIKDVFMNTFQKVDVGSRLISGDSIRLMNSFGKSLVEVCGYKGSGKKSTRGVLDLTETIILDAIRQGASDILIDPKSDSVYVVRYRIDGFLRTVSSIDSEIGMAIVNIIKVLSGMDIAERRRAQDGAFTASTGKGTISLRVASAGVLGGEKLSIRVLDQSTGLLSLEDIGLPTETCDEVNSVLIQSSGAVLLCGPTGSGKTTTLYAMLGTIDFNARNVITIEDPIEYMLADASQIEVNVRAGVTFANGLRNMLRQDPDVICVGEIRDGETAAMAMQASETGHLVLATIHSSSNMEALVRLMDFGVRPLLLASALSVIVSQRLVRQLCENCKKPSHLTAEQLADFQDKGIKPTSVMEAVGCNMCGHTGYRGRTGIFDVLRLTDEVKTNLINNEWTMGDLKKLGDEKGRSNLRKAGMKKVAAGLTTLQEVDRVTSRI